MMDKVTRQYPQTTTFLKRKESRSGIEPRSLRVYQPNALPLGQTGSHREGGGSHSVYVEGPKTLKRRGNQRWKVWYEESGGCEYQYTRGTSWFNQLMMPVSSVY